MDIGTTTVAVVLTDLKSGRIIDSATNFNRQISCGEDVISRIIFAGRGDGFRQLRQLVRETINGLLYELCERQEVDTRNIDHLVVSGNTTMMHMFLGLEPRYIREEPYAPVAMRCTRDSQRPACSTLTHLVAYLQLFHRSTSTIGLQRSCATTSCNMLLFRLRSATSCFNVRFFSSSCFSRHTSATPSPANSFFQR